MTCQHVTGPCPGETCPCRPKTPCVDCGTWPAINREPSRCNACVKERDSQASWLVCPECSGGGADLEDSSRDCWKCGGFGIVKPSSVA